MDDWRLIDQDKYLMNSYLVKIHFVPEENIDHMHCAFCWDKFSENSEDLNIGYCTKDKKHWICEECFNDFKKMFSFKLLVDKSIEPYKF